MKALLQSAAVPCSLFARLAAHADAEQVSRMQSLKTASHAWV